MDPLRLCIALAPLALYFLYLSYLNLRQRPMLVGGGFDLWSLGLGVSGLMFVGPIELLLPSMALFRLGAILYLLTAAFYCLGLWLLVLVSRPRLVIYNVDALRCRAILHEVSSSLDPESRWAGNCLSMPNLRVELHVEANRAMRNVSLVATQDEQSFTGWRRLHGAVKAPLSQVETSRSAWGACLLAAAAAMTAMLGWQFVANQQAVTQAFRDLLHL